MDDKKNMGEVLGRFRLGKKKELVFDKKKTKEEMFKERVKNEEETVNEEFKRKAYQYGHEEDCSHERGNGR